MLYKKNDDETLQVEPERFELINVVAILLLILLTVIAVASPEIIYRNIINITKDFGMNL